MADKAVGQATNLLQRLTLALSAGAAEARVDYVPVSRDPYVRVTLGSEFDAMESLRERLLAALGERGFRRFDAFTLHQDGPRGTLYVEVGTPVHDPVTGRAVLDLQAVGPYRVPQSGNPRERDVVAERRAFAASALRADMDRVLRAQGSWRVVGTLLAAAPFPVPADDLAAIRTAAERPAVAMRIARAFAGQSLASYEDFVAAAGLGPALGREPEDAAPSPRP